MYYILAFNKECNKTQLYYAIHEWNEQFIALLVLSELVPNSYNMYIKAIYIWLIVRKNGNLKKQVHIS